MAINTEQFISSGDSKSFSAQESVRANDFRDYSREVIHPSIIQIHDGRFALWINSNQPNSAKYLLDQLGEALQSAKMKSGKYEVQYKGVKFSRILFFSLTQFNDLVAMVKGDQMKSVKYRFAAFFKNIFG